MNARDTLTTADYEEVLAGQRALARELDVLLNGQEGAAQQAALGDLVAQVRRSGIIVATRNTGRWLALGEAIERAAAVLPDGYEVAVELEKGASTVALYDTDGDRMTEFLGDTLAEQVANAIEYAIARAEELGEVLPDGLRRNGDGELTFQCKACGFDSEWPADIEQFDVNNPANMCGRSPRCCP